MIEVLKTEFKKIREKYQIMDKDNQILVPSTSTVAYATDQGSIGGEDCVIAYKGTQESYDIYESTNALQLEFGSVRYKWAKNEQVTEKPPQDTDARTGCTERKHVRRVSVTLPFPFLFLYKILKNLKIKIKTTKELEPALRKKFPNSQTKITQTGNQNIARSKVAVTDNDVRLLLTKTPKISTDRQKETKKGEILIEYCRLSSEKHKIETF